MPEVVVAIVTYNSAQVIDEFLEALPDALDCAPTTRVIIVDNASSDDTLERVRRRAPWVEIRSTGRNAGYAAAINAALREVVGSEGVMVMNPDAIAAPGLVATLLEATREPGVGIAVPRIEDGDGQLKFSLRRETTLLRALGEAVLGGHRAARFAALGDQIRDPAEYIDGAVADWATGAAMFVSRLTLDTLGLWDESFFLYSEETDFALRARDANLALRYTPSAVVHHPGGAMEESPWLWSLVAINRVLLYRRRHGPVSGAVFWLVVVFNEGLRALLGRQTNREALRALLGLTHPRDQAS